jgi:hypothetical protein
VARKYAIKTSHGWPQIIFFYSNDDHAAFELFFELFGEFMESKGLTTL